MLRTISITRTDNHLIRLAAIAFFVVLVAIAAKIKVDIGAVPITMQPLVVLLAGMVLGARDGAASLFSYVSLIALGFPLDANSLGTVALFGPTGGYLIGFVMAAFTAGYLVERGADKVWQRWIAGIIAVAVIYVFGFMQLKVYTGMDWQAAWMAGVAPFIVLDLLKALVAAGLVEGMRSALLVNSDVYTSDKK